MPRTVLLSLGAVALFPAAALSSVLLVPIQYADVPAALAAAQSGDTIRVELNSVGFTPGLYGYNFGRGVDFAGRSIQIDFNGQNSFQFERTAVFTLANASSIQFDTVVSWAGTLVMPAGAAASISDTSTFSTSSRDAAQFVLGANSTLNLSAYSFTGMLGTFRLAPGASLFLNAASSGLAASGTSFIAEEGSTLSLPGSFTLSGALTSLGGGLRSGQSFTVSGGTISVIDGSWVAGSETRATNSTLNLSNCTVVGRGLELSNATRLAGSGEWFVDLTVGSGSQAIFLADSTVVGAYRNFGRTVVQNGTLVIAGSLMNDGDLVGDIVGPPGAAGAPGLSIAGDLSVGELASLAFPGGLLRITGNADIDILTGTNMDLQGATLHIGAPGGDSTLEVMGRDVGPSGAGFIRSFTGFPVGSLVVSGRVRLVDVRRNGSPGAGVLYVGDLRIPAGATLLTEGKRIYYRTLTLAGGVDQPANLIPVPECVADFDDSGSVSIQDVFAFLGAYFAGEARADINHNGVVSFPDVFDFLAAYFAGCA